MRVNLIILGPNINQVTDLIWLIWLNLTLTPTKLSNESRNWIKCVSKYCAKVCCFKLKNTKLLEELKKNKFVHLVCATPTKMRDKFKSVYCKFSASTCDVLLHNKSSLKCLIDLNIMKKIFFCINSLSFIILYHFDSLSTHAYFSTVIIYHRIKF